ncbi:MAG TPA: hypothetical protein DHV48_12870 [Prolixibacteraceae bacterium]|nr:hypothetical protein [Prolixibacteraceae bacterium]
MDTIKTKQLTAISRRAMLNFITGFLLEIIGKMKENYIESGAPEMGEAAKIVSDDAVLISCLFKTLLEQGSPAEVVFISQTGKRISLKTDKNLTENELVNLILDNAETH